MGMILRSEFPGSIRRIFSGNVTTKKFPELHELILIESDQTPESDPEPVNPVNVRLRLGTIATMPGHLSVRYPEQDCRFRFTDHRTPRAAVIARDPETIL